MFDDMLDDPQSAATLFEMVEPSLPQPTAVIREFTPLPGIPRWTLRTKAGTLRLKLAGDVGTAAQLARGAGMLQALLPLVERGQAPLVPRLRRLELNLNETDLSVVLEERLGATDARSVWPQLSTTARCALAQAAAERLLVLHAIPLGDLPVLSSATRAWGEPRTMWGAAAGRPGAASSGSRGPSSSRADPQGSPAGGTTGGTTGASNGDPHGARSAGGGGAVGRPGPVRPQRPWRDLVVGRIERRVAALRGDGILENDLLARVETRLRTAAGALPADLDRRPCHGAYGLESVVLVKTPQGTVDRKQADRNPSDGNPSVDNRPVDNRPVGNRPADGIPADESRAKGTREDAVDEGEAGGSGRVATAGARKARSRESWTVLGIRDFEVACAGDPWMDVAYWLASSGDPDGVAARRFFETYRDRALLPPDLPARIDLYAGLMVLHAIAHLAPNFTDEGSCAISEVTESWVSTPPRPWM